MFRRHLEQFPADTIDTDPDDSGILVFTGFDMDIRTTEFVTFNNDPVYQLNNAGGFSSTFIIAILLLIIDLNAGFAFEILEYVIEALNIILLLNRTAKVHEDMFRQTNPENIVTGIENTLNFHDFLIVTGVAQQDDNFLLAAGNREPEVITQIGRADILHQVSWQGQFRIIFHVGNPVIEFQRLANLISFNLVVFHEHFGDSTAIKGNTLFYVIQVFGA